MKARKKDSNDEWQDVDYVQLVNSYVITKADQMEFQDTLSTELKTYGQIGMQDHWQDVRERAAIAAMQGLINAFSLSAKEEKIAICAVKQADALIKELKKEQQ